jgi:hypothetical protein
MGESPDALSRVHSVLNNYFGNPDWYMKWLGTIDRRYLARIWTCFIDIKCKSVVLSEPFTHGNPISMHVPNSSPPEKPFKIRRFEYRLLLGL